MINGGLTTSQSRVQLPLDPIMGSKRDMDARIRCLLRPVLKSMLEGYLFDQKNEQVSSFSLSERDPFTQGSYADLLFHQKINGLPLFVVHTGGQVYEAASFMRNYFYHENTQHPTTREPIAGFTIYKSRRETFNEFKYVCNQNTFPGKNDHWAKYINAASQDLSNMERGKQQFYMAVHYEQKATATTDVDVDAKAKYLSKSKFWLNLSKVNGVKDADMMLALWFANGNIITEPNLAKVQEHLKNIVHSSTYNPVIVRCYKEALQKRKEDLVKEIEQEIAFCQEVEKKSREGIKDDTQANLHS